MLRLWSYFPRSRGKPPVDDKRDLSDTIFNNRNSLRRCGAPAGYGPPKMLYYHGKRLSDMGVFARTMTGLAAEIPDNKTISTNVTYPLPGNRCLQR
jgi:hypothetical protein